MNKFKKFLPAYLVSASFVFVGAAYITNAFIERVVQLKDQTGASLEKFQENWWVTPLIIAAIYSVFFVLGVRLFKKGEDIQTEREIEKTD